MTKPLPSLKAMAENHVPGINKQTTFQVDPRIVKKEVSFNGRFETAGVRDHINAMKQSMRNGATFPPIDVRVEDGEIFVVDGHCRTTAATELIEEDGQERRLDARHFKGAEDERVAHMMTSNQGRPFTGLELGHIYERLRRMGWSVAAICARNGKSDTHVEQMMMLAQSPLALQGMIIADQVSAATAVTMIQKHGEKKALELLQDALRLQADKGGKPKVTKKTLLGPSYSRATVSEMVTSLDTFYTRLSDQNRYDLQTVFEKNDVELEGKMISLPATSLKVLLDAHSKVLEERNKHEQRKEKTSQGDKRASDTKAKA